jgi:anti-sigma regulatory factor (Ser/Thr protein kinase)
MNAMPISNQQGLIMSVSSSEQSGYQEVFQAAAQPGQLETAMQWLGARAEILALDKRLALRIQLVLEELFLNTLLHGYTEHCDNTTITLELKVQPDVAWLVYTDNAPTFDVYQELSSLAPADPTREGGKGLYLIRELPSRLDYQALDSGNRVSLCFSRHAPAA